MLFRIEGQQHTDLASVTPAAKSADSQEVFSVSLDREMFQVLAAGLKRLGLETSRLETASIAGCQFSVNHGGSRQIFATSEGPSPAGSPVNPRNSHASEPSKPGFVPPGLVRPRFVPPGFLKAGFVPQFQQDAKVLSVYGDVWNLNPAFYATRETAEWMAQKYGTGEVVEVPYGTPGSPFSSTATQLHIKLHNGQLVNAGLLADYYRGIPEATFPGLADREIRDQLIKDYGVDALLSAG